MERERRIIYDACCDPAAAMIDVWVVDEGDDAAAVPRWLAKALKGRVKDRLLVLTSEG